MTVGSRRLAARCRQQFATDPTTLTTTAEPTQPEPPTTVAATDVDAAAEQENVDAAT